MVSFPIFCKTLVTLPILCIEAKHVVHIGDVKLCQVMFKIELL